MENLSKPAQYRSYLLRMWAAFPGEPRVWRFSLEDPHTGERHGFANWDSLRDFIKEVMEQAEDESLGNLSV